jgi:hypothetical protein
LRRSYAYMKALFRNLYARLGFAYDGRYDWTEEGDAGPDGGTITEDPELYEYSQDVESRSYDDDSGSTY